MTKNTKMLKTKKIQISVFVKKSQKKKEMEKGEQLSQIWMPASGTFWVPKG